MAKRTKPAPAPQKATRIPSPCLRPANIPKPVEEPIDPEDARAERDAERDFASETANADDKEYEW